MCGIAGFLAPRTGGEEFLSWGRSLRMAVKRLRHRGPDDSGIWLESSARIGLGNRRLAVIDRSPGGHQPMTSPCGRYTLTVNGEIYNFRELRERLRSAGYRFHSSSDTEVLLAAISIWSVPRALHEVEGMFAFAVWDRQLRRLTLARDRLGEKPLYYGLIDRAVAFASEVQALVDMPGWHGEIDRGALCLLLRLGYIPAPWSLYRGIFKLLPGSYLSVRPDVVNELPKPTRYWSLATAYAAGEENPFRGAPEEAITHLQGLVSQAVRRQLVADVPVGVFLSGGIDSSYVAALVQEAKGGLQTFSIAFEDPVYDESGWARGVAEYLGSEHFELRLGPIELADTAVRMAEIFDEPIADSSQIPTFLLAQWARQKVTVCLAGDGADELFAGYTHYPEVLKLWRRLRRWPRSARKRMARLLRNAHSSWPLELLPLFSPVQRYLGIGGAARDALYRSAWALDMERPLDLYRARVVEWNAPEDVVLGAREPTSALTEPGPIRPENAELLRSMLLLDGTNYLPDDILTKVDRASMAVGLEVRLPYLDRRVVEFACRLPPSLLVAHGETKRILRRATARKIPLRLTNPRKQGFGIPLDDLLRGPLRAWAEALLEKERLRREGIFDPEPIRRRWREHLEVQGSNFGGPLWSILQFQSWYQATRARGSV